MVPGKHREAMSLHCRADDYSYNYPPNRITRQMKHRILTLCLIAIIALATADTFGQGKVTRPGKPTSSTKSKPSTNKKTNNRLTIIRKGQYHKDITEVKIPNSVTTICESAFENCTSLATVNIPNSVRTIGFAAFRHCESLTTVNIPNSISTLDGTFVGCKSLRSIVIPKSVTAIKNSTFYACSSLLNINIPMSVQYIEAGAFEYCSNLNAFYGKFATPDNRCLVVNGTLVGFAPKGLYSYQIPNSVKVIGQSAFGGAKELHHIVIPNSVTSIETGAFSDCESLDEVVLPASIRSIGQLAFRDCNALKSITIPKSVEEIGDYAFVNCSLKVVRIPKECKIRSTSFSKWCEVIRY